MLRRRLSGRLRRCAALILLVTDVARARSPRRGSITSRPTTRSTSTASRCATGSGSSRRSTSPRTRSQRYPILLIAHALQRAALRRRRLQGDLGPSPLFGKEGYIFAYQDVRGRWMSEGEFVNMRPHRDRKKQARHDIDESTDTYDTIDWLIKNVPEPQRPGRACGASPTRLLHGGRDDRRPPGAQGGLAAGAGDRLVHRRRLAPQRRLLPAARLQLPRRLRPPAARADQEGRSNASSTARPTATTSSSAWARSPTPTSSTSRATCRSGTRSCSTGPTTSSGRPATSGRT